ncbi:MAG TPA: hypothetical protein EYH29_06040 [Caldilineales bacterium]|nr:hypothetical protein [Caldilineales bacterium]
MSPISSFLDIQPEALQRIARNRPAFWIALLLTAATLGALGVGIAWFGWPMGLSGAALAISKAGVVLTPGLLWMGIFALLEREEKGLHHINFLLWLVTAALYVAMVQPLLTRAFALDAWLFMSWWTDILADFLIIAPLELLLIYLVLRIGVYPTEALSRLVDGPVFGVAAGLGVAAIVNWLRVGASDPLTPWDALVAGGWAMGYGAMGGWLGYALARARLSHPVHRHLAAVFSLMVLFHTCFYALIRAVNAFTFLAPVLALMLASISFALLAWRMHNERLACQRLAARLEQEQKRIQSRSLLADVMRMAGAYDTDVSQTPLAPLSTSVAPSPPEDELASLKRSWEALIAEQEGTS